jgi:hypothetical protein
MASSTRTIAPNEQMILPLSPVRNRDFLSNHWLEHRLPLEPEWQEYREAANNALNHFLSLWRVESARVALYGNEAGLEEKFIQPVFEILGWHLKYQTFLKGREPDYALFLRDNDLHAALSAGRTSPDFWSHAAAVGDAKAWHVSLDRPTRDGGHREYPPEQIEWYLNQSLRDYGILTNGRLWRLVPRVLGPAKPRFQTYLEVKHWGKALEEGDDHFSFFSKVQQAQKHSQSMRHCLGASSGQGTTGGGLPFFIFSKSTTVAELWNLVAGR